LATKPVATFGTSRARTAVAANAVSAAAAAEIRMVRRLPIGLSGWALWLVLEMPESAQTCSPYLENGLAESCGGLAESKNIR
jgi:hypothetical protein